MGAANTIRGSELERFRMPSHPPLHWLGPQRLRVLRLRDRLVPWQMRHLYYRHEPQARLGAHLSIGLVVGHVLMLALQGIANIVGLSNTFPLDILQAGAILAPGLMRSARRVRLSRGKSLYQTAQPANDIMLLIEGYGRLCMEHEDGRRLTVGLVAPGVLFGEEALLDIPERESAFEAVLDSQIDIISTRRTH